VALSPKDGGVICNLCVKNGTIVFDITHSGVKLLRVLSSIDIIRIKEIKISESDLEKTHELVSTYAEYFFERRLNSKEFLNLMRRKSVNDR
jgi:recombinational DNA repair protein (RecF pathway)